MSRRKKQMMAVAVNINKVIIGFLLQFQCCNFNVEMSCCSIKDEKKDGVNV